MTYQIPDLIRVELARRVELLYELNRDDDIPTFSTKMLAIACQLAAAHELRELSRSFHAMEGFGSPSGNTIWKVIGDEMDKRANVIDPEGITKQQAL